MNPMAAAVRINGPRLWSRLMEMAQIGATAQGGCNRQALTDLDLQARALWTRWAQAAGCTVRVDAVGNLFALRAGSDVALPVVMTGSHLDTQPTGGKYDGVYGVLAGLEAIESLNEHAVATRHPLELCVWCNEEGSRFPMAMMGSAVWAGRLPLEAAHALTDAHGVSVRAALDRAGIQGAQASRQPVKAALEVHIEQGPLLERAAKVIGVVTGVQHMSRHEVTIIGEEAHAGPTPMELRRDPVRAFAQMVPAMYAEAAALAPHARMTIGRIETWPGSPNTVPGRMQFTVDLRHPESASYQVLLAALQRHAAAAFATHRLQGDVRCVWEAPGVSFDAGCVSAVRAAAGALGLAAMDMVSGAGHDSCNLAAVVPAGMVFIPCAGGLSHNEAESAAPQDLEAGANVLLQALLALAA